MGNAGTWKWIQISHSPSWCPLGLEPAKQPHGQQNEKRLGVLKKVTKHLNFNYCEVILSCMHVSYMDSLQKLQNREASCQLDKRSHVTDMLGSLKWFSIKQQCDLHTTTMVYKNWTWGGTTLLNKLTTRWNFRAQLWNKKLCLWRPQCLLESQAKNFIMQRFQISRLVCPLVWEMLSF